MGRTGSPFSGEVRRSLSGSERVALIHALSAVQFRHQSNPLLCSNVHFSRKFSSRPVPKADGWSWPPGRLTANSSRLERASQNGVGVQPTGTADPSVQALAPSLWAAASAC